MEIKSKSFSGTLPRVTELINEFIIMEVIGNKEIISISENEQKTTIWYWELKTKL